MLPVQSCDARPGAMLAGCDEQRRPAVVKVGLRDRILSDDSGKCPRSAIFERGSGERLLPEHRDKCNSHNERCDPEDSAPDVHRRAMWHLAGVADIEIV